MTSSDPTPKLPLWIFLVADAALLGAAVFIARDAARPLSNAAIISIVACVLAGALVVLVPLVMYFERQKNETLDDRQRALETLARTITSSAEQISIATGGLHGIAELAQKNLRQAEHLPHKLQEKIAEFQAQLNNATDAEKEELENELVALRTTESERLQAISDKIARTVAEFAKLEAATHQHLAAGAAALGGIEARFAGAGAAVVERIAQELAKLSVVAPAFPTAAAAHLEEKSAAPQDSTVSSESAADPTSSPKSERTAHPPKRPRKPRRDDLAAVSPEEEESPVGAAAGVPPADAPVASVSEPPPIPAEKNPEIAPVAPSTDTPVPAGHVATPSDDATPAEVPPSSDAPPIPRKRSTKKSEPEATADLDLGIDDSSHPASSSAERVLTSDGATRLIVTAYIGIGNRLFIRGEGTGLSWEKGVPLQFVSIGKWRWETNDASAPVQFKLYKNDEVECTALGQLSVDPGYQQEVIAAF